MTIRIASISGGGSRGAWHAGVARYLTSREGAQYDAAHGISVGSLNAVGLCQHADSRVAAEVIEARWYSLRGTGDVLRSRGPWLTAIAAESLYTVDPLRARLTDWAGTRVIKPCVAWAVETMTGALGRYDLASLSLDKRVEALLASSSYPLAMPPVGTMRDGGLRSLFPLRECLDEYPTADVIDVLVCSPLDGPELRERAYGPGEELMRCVELLSFGVALNSLNEAKVSWLERKLRGERVPTVRIYAPSVMPTPDPMAFDKSAIEAAIRQGFDDAARGPWQEWR